MSWVTPSDITAVYADVELTQGFIDHVQALAEGCTGAQTEPVNDQLKAVFIEVVYRKHLSGESNPEGLTMETLGSYSRQHSAAPGLTITKTECRALKKAAGVWSLSVVPATIGQNVETPSWEDPHEPDPNDLDWT